MKITDIAKSKGTRYTIYVDGEYWFNVDFEIILQNQLKIDMFVDEDFLDNIKIQCERRKARERAYYLLSYRDHSKTELYRKLLDSAREEIALSIVTMVEEQGLINDEKYAAKLSKYYLETKKWGARRAAMEMRRKGLDKSLIDEALAECEVDTVAQITSIIEKKYSGRLDDFKEKQKVIAALSRLGFDYSDIKMAISEYSNTEYEYDDE